MDLSANQNVLGHKTDQWNELTVITPQPMRLKKCHMAANQIKEKSDTGNKLLNGWYHMQILILQHIIYPNKKMFTELPDFKNIDKYTKSVEILCKYTKNT